MKISSDATLNDIKEALKYGKHLSVLMVEMSSFGHKISINLNELNSILYLAKLVGVKVIIYDLSEAKINVPMDFLYENRKWIDI